MININPGAMSGNIGRLIWVSGSDSQAKGYRRFGVMAWTHWPSNLGSAGIVFPFTKRGLGTPWMH
jgi:hypothetical protein